MQIIGTTPHSLCLPTDTEKEHFCDLAAWQAGQIFDKKMVGLDISSKWFASDTHRTVYDMNRKPSRQTEYRKKVSKYLDEKLREGSKKGKEVWVVDIHSFPDSYKDFEGHEVVLLILPDEMENPRTVLLTKNLKEAKIDCGVYEASQLNDIMVTSIDAGAYSILIEINEKLSTKRMEEVMKVIGSWIKEWDDASSGK